MCSLDPGSQHIMTRLRVGALPIALCQRHENRRRQAYGTYQ